MAVIRSNATKNDVDNDIPAAAASVTSTTSVVTASKHHRTKSPGVRIIGGRIYDSDNGKTCHQCRQKTRDFVATCKNLKKHKPCTISFCHKCLLNRYGEKAEDMALLEEWDCPKCRGKCNCSFCMKKRGQKPTGILVHRAKATGFSSVSDMLYVGGAEDIMTQTVGVLPEKKLSPIKKKRHVSLKKRGKENSPDGIADSNIELPTLASDLDKKKPTKVKRKVPEGGHESNGGDLTVLRRVSPRKHQEPKNVKPKLTEKTQESNDNELTVLGRVSPRELQESKNPEETQESNGDKLTVLRRVSPRKHQVSKGTPNKTVITPNNDCVVIDDKDCNAHEKGALKPLETVNDATKPKMVVDKLKKSAKKLFDSSFDVDIPLPLGTEFAIVSGVEIPPEVTGQALQFLEFCSAFGPVLDLKKGVAACVLQEVIHGPRGRRAQYSSNVQLHIQLISTILSDKGEEVQSLSPTHGKNSWLKALGEYISESKLVIEDLPSDCFDRGANGYNEMHFSKKLRLLNFMCDEALCTEKFRIWIDNQNIKCAKKEKEAKENVTAARLKEKSMKQKMHDEVAKAILAKSNAPLSISEHEAVVAQIKLEAAQAHSEMLAAMEMLPKKRKKCDSVRTEPVLVDVDGRVYWRLECCGKSEILLQELGMLDGVAMSEKWMVYDAEQKQEIEEYISSRTRKILRSQVVLNTVWSESNGSSTDIVF